MKILHFEAIPEQIDDLEIAFSLLARAIRWRPDTLWAGR